MLQSGIRFQLAQSPRLFLLWKHKLPPAAAVALVVARGYFYPVFICSTLSLVLVVIACIAVVSLMLLLTVSAAPKAFPPSSPSSSGEARGEKVSNLFPSADYIIHLQISRHIKYVILPSCLPPFC